MTVLLKVARIDPDVPLPSHGHPGDIGYDLYASKEVMLAPGERVQVGTGLRFEIPEGYAAFIWDKSGLSHNHGLKTLGGVIDAGYRGEVKVGMINLSDVPYTIEKCHKVAQMIIQRKEEVTIVEEFELTDTLRGEGGFGSTGK